MSSKESVEDSQVSSWLDAHRQLVRRLTAFAVLVCMALVLVYFPGRKGLAHGRRDGGRASRVPVLVYHDLVTAGAARGQEPGKDRQGLVTVQQFRREMRSLSRQGYTSVTMVQFRQFMLGERQLPARSVLITFDGGYRSFYTQALPVLKHYGFTAALFVAGREVTGESGQAQSRRALGSPRLTSTQLKSIARQGFSVQSASWIGPGWLPGQTLCQESSSEIKADLARQARWFSQLKLPVPVALAYPGGRASFEALQDGRDQQVSLFFTTRPGLAQPGHMAAIPRLAVRAGLNLGVFKRLLTQAGSDQPSQDGQAAQARRQQQPGHTWCHGSQPSGNGLQVVVDGYLLAGSAAAGVQNGTIYVRLRQLAAALGAGLTWQGKQRRAVLTSGSARVIVRPGSSRLTVNGHPLHLAAASYLDHQQLVVPVRPIANALGLAVRWQGEGRHRLVISSRALKPASQDQAASR